VDQARLEFSRPFIVPVCLISTGTHRAGHSRQEYDQAIEALSGGDERRRYYREDTLFRWAEQEFSFGKMGEARLLLGKAMQEADEFKVPNRRKAERKRIKERLDLLRDDEEIEIPADAK
jgi:hypothetical protein